MGTSQLLHVPGRNALMGSQRLNIKYLIMEFLRDRNKKQTLKDQWV